MSKKVVSMMMVAGLASVASAQLYTNGSLASLQTGATTQGGTPAPAGGQWSEVGSDTVNLKIDNVAGSTASGTFRLADNFTVPAGQTWNVTGFRFWTYESGATTATVNNCTIRIHNQDPQLGAPAAFGDLTTNRFSSVTMTDTYRIFNTATVGLCAGTAPGTTRRLQEVNAAFTQTLTAGNYWVDWAMEGSATFTGPWGPALNVKPLGSGVQYAGANGLQLNGVFAPALGSWFDANGGCVQIASVIAFEYPFVVLGSSGGGCRPDLTTGAIPGQSGYGVPNGTVNNDDFFYFLSLYAQNLGCAVCPAPPDMTTTAIPGSPGYGVPNGVLNNDDFFFYLTIFSTPC